jgi:hypothetical protein
LGQLLVLLKYVKSKLLEVTAVVSEKDFFELEDQDPSHSGTDLVATHERRSATIRCSSVDNFQGEEADIVVGSIVRSNKHGSIGFLKEEQRVNVFLSRARIGMFLVGNSECLRHSKAGHAVWSPILEMLAADGNLRFGLPTTCQLHPDDEPIELRTPEDFRSYRPNGGCNRPCDYRMPCGHTCPKTCHPIDRRHEDAQRLCVEPCRRFPSDCRSSHACLKLCNEECGRCEASVGQVDLMCGHKKIAKCYEIGSEEALSALASRCLETVNHTFADCEHSATTACSNARSSKPKCPVLCGKACACGHLCKRMYVTLTE